MNQLRSLFNMKVTLNIVMGLMICSYLIAFTSSALAEEVIKSSGVFYTRLPDDVDLHQINLNHVNVAGPGADELDAAFRVGIFTSKAKFKDRELGRAYFTEIFYSNFDFEGGRDKFSFQSLGLDVGYGPAVNLFQNVYFQALPFLGAGIMFAEFESAGIQTGSETAFFGEYGIKAGLNIILQRDYQLGVFGGYMRTQAVKFEEGPFSSNFGLENSGAFGGVSISRIF